MAVTKSNINDIDNDPAKVGVRYGVSHPHPMHGKDPNILDVYGRTEYPKYVAHPTKKQEQRSTTYIGKDARHNIIPSDKSEIPEMVIVNSKEEEDALLGKKPEKVTTKQSVGWKE